MSLERATKVGIQRSTRRIAATRIRTTARRLLDASTLCAIATVTPGGRAHVNTAYFAWTRQFHLLWLSEPRARHSLNLRSNSSVAIAVYDSNQSWGRPDRGIQLFGSARELEGEAAKHGAAVYGRRFPEYRDADLGAYRLYEFRSARLKLFDERELGTATFVTASVRSPGRLEWERTDVYDAGS